MLRFDVPRAVQVGLLALALAGCQPEIGDDCDLSTDCSAAGDRLCDTTQPGGYCTIFNCEPGSCPEEAVCIGFKRAPSTAAECSLSGTRLMRTFCLRRCDDDSDCRSGYACIDMGKANPIGAFVAEYGANGKVCAVPVSALELPDDYSTEVCTGTDAGFDVPDVPDGGAGGAGGEGGAGGAGGGGGLGGAAGAGGGADAGASDAAADASSDA
jgi:hypothetical protein